MGKIRVVFMGSPDFAAPVLRMLADHFTVAGVVTQPDKPAGRGRELRPSPVRVTAMELGLPVIQPEKLKSNVEAFEQLQGWDPAVIVVAAFGKILRKNILDLPPFGCVNVHASLLPRWRGSSPIQAAILHGDAQSGVTLMKMDEGVDTGDMLGQTVLDIRAEETAGTLETRLAEAGAALLADILPRYLAGQIKPVPQPAGGQTYAPLLKKEDGALDFSQPVHVLERQVRAYDPWPGCYLPLDGGILKVLKAYTVPDPAAQPGKKVILDKRPAVGALGGYLVFSQVQQSGKKALDGKAFLSGYRGWH
jgi:methionyl-tRNA formyltransferase